MQVSRHAPVLRQVSKRIRNRRSFASTSSQPSSSPLSLSQPCYAPIPNRSVISVTGPEPNLSNFLNGIIATQVMPSPGGTDHTGFYSTFLNRHGRIYYDAFFHPNPDPIQPGYLIEYDPRPAPAELLRDPGVEKEAIPPLPTLLKRFVLRSKVKVRDVSDEWVAWAIWGGDAERVGERMREKVWTGWKWASSSGAVEPTWLGSRSPDIRLWGHGTSEDVTLTPYEKGKGTGSWDWRSPQMGRRVILPKTLRPNLSAQYAEGTPFDYARHRIMNGVPEGSVDLAEAIPFDRNVDIMGGLNFRKGCYLGQENVVRTYHTGMIRKRTIPVELVPLGQTTTSLSSDQLDPAPARFSEITLRLTAAGIAAAQSSSSSPRRTTAKRGPDYVRSKGKLLSRAGHWALAQIRLEHLEAFEKGEMSMSIVPDPESGDNAGAGWSVTPRLPAWWPRALVGEVGTHAAADSGSTQRLE